MSTEPTPPHEKLEAARNRFLDSLGSAREDLADNQQFLGYWQAVEQQSQQTEDLGQLDRWVKELASDRGRVEALIERKQATASHDTQAAQILMLLRQILAILDDLYDRIRKRHHELHDRIAWWRLLAPAGKKSKPLPKGLGDQKPEEKKDQTVKTQNLAKQKEKKKPTKQKAP